MNSDIIPASTSALLGRSWSNGRLAQLHAQHAALASQREAEVSAMFEPLTENDGEIDWAALLKEDQV
jgi:hypothetical protein